MSNPVSYVQIHTWLFSGESNEGGGLTYRVKSLNIGWQYLCCIGEPLQKSNVNLFWFSLKGRVNLLHCSLGEQTARSPADQPNVTS